MGKRERNTVCTADGAGETRKLGKFSKAGRKAHETKEEALAAWADDEKIGGPKLGFVMKGDK